MKTVAPNYYNDFRCIADRCCHSCCKGWEICIDGETLEKYSNIDGELGRRLAESIEDSAFVLKEDESCPFLNDNGLCDIITESGEGFLCEICREHPRFYNCFSHCTEVGLGLSCEEAARIILSQKDITKLMLLEDGESMAPFDEEKELIEKRDLIFCILQDGSKSIHQRAEEMMRLVGAKLPDKSFSQWKELFLQLEILDVSWRKKLDFLNDCIPDIPPEFEMPLEKLLLYFVYRHASASYDSEDFSARIAFAYLGYTVIRNICLSESKSFECLCDTARQYSAEIEYSEENTETLINLLKYQ